ncbi:F-box protein At5g25290-like [Phragmites australis]|uniref:F-box protein At5g25290-like n=1 Tax=Phragmites australis TaxID=29695 RepID=UPI002D7859D0|nr:F-box protein At5g25290-like [Phragmites australis]
MEMCIRDGMMSLGCLCRLVLRALPKILAFSPSLLKTVQRDDHAHPPLMESAIVGSESLGLPQDILMDIFALLEIPDLVRAGSVCSSWHAAYTSLCVTGPCRLQQTPCLLYTSESAGARAAGLYSLTEKKAYTVTLPDPPIRSRHIIGSSYGWIITADERSELHLVNPITGEQIALPSVTTIEQVKPIFDHEGAVCNYEYSWYTGDDIISDTPSIFVPSKLRDFLFYKAFLSSDPAMGDYFVVLIHNPHSQLSFARAGDDKWTWLPPHSDYADCFFKGGLLYASTLLGEIHTIDLGDPAVTQEIFLGKVKDIYYERIYIVQAPCGELLQIWRSDADDEYDSDLEIEFDRESYVSITSAIKVHKVEPTSKKLVEISSLGENVMFLGHNQSLCLRAEEYPQLKANHVYFTDDDDLYIMGFQNNRRDIGVFDLENNSSDEIVSPQLWSNWPAPVWLIPNPRSISLASRN